MVPRYCYISCVKLKINECTESKCLVGKRQSKSVKRKRFVFVISSYMEGNGNRMQKNLSCLEDCGHCQRLILVLL